MPVKSEAQRRAMWAAREGHSTLGISPAVGRKFVGPGRDAAKDMEPTDWRGLIKGLIKFFTEEAEEPEHQGEDAEKRYRITSTRNGKGEITNYRANSEAEAREKFLKTAGKQDKIISIDLIAEDAQVSAAGIIFTDPENNALFLKRSGKGDHPNEYCFPGGVIEDGEDAETAARREATEELGILPKWDLDPVHRAESDEGVDFTTFQQSVGEQFEPKLNDEHDDYVWAPLDNPPDPLHPGVAAMLSQDEVCNTLGSACKPPPSSNPQAKPTGTEGREDADSDGGMDIELGANATSHPAKHATERGEIAGKTGVTGGPPTHKAHSSSGKAVNGRFTMPDGMTWLSNDSADDCDTPTYTARAGKLSHTEVAYTGTGKPKSHCGICQFFHDQGCELVVDPIVREGWCKLFTADSEDATTAMDEKVLQLAMDKCVIASSGGDTFALDRGAGSVREYDADGRLHVAMTNISKANICPYLGEEIPDYEKLGLKPKQIYQLLRDPAELEKAVATFNGIPVLREHIPVSADDHQSDEVIGSTGNDAVFEDPYLRNSIVIWTQEDIDKIESGEKKELSCGYRYIALMEPGEFKGTHFDGKMTALCGNHLAVCESGRAGIDCRVADSVNPNVGWAAIEDAILKLKELA